MTTRREKVEKAKKIIIATTTSSSDNRLVTAKLAVKFGGEARDYIGLVKQAKKEVKYAAIAAKAFPLHLQEGGSWHRNTKKFASLVQMGPAKPMCPFPALKQEAEAVLSSWKQETRNIKTKAWRARVNLAKDAIENGDDPAEILQVTYPADNPLLRQKVVAVAQRELYSSHRCTMADVRVGTKNTSGSGRKMKKKEKRKKLAQCQQDAKKIFGLCG